MTETFLSMFSTPDDQMEEITLDQFKQDMDNLIAKKGATMEKPELPEIANPSPGIVIQLRPEDIPETFPEPHRSLALYLLQMNDTDKELFQQQFASVEAYIKQMKEAVDKYETLSYDDDPSVPEWYKALDGWHRDQNAVKDLYEDESWQPAVLERIEEHADPELTLKCDLLLDIWWAPWADLFESLVHDINLYKENTK